MQLQWLNKTVTKDFISSQVQQHFNPNSRRYRFHFRYGRRVAIDGDSKCLSSRSASALGRVPKQVLRGRWVQIQSFRICVAR